MAYLLQVGMGPRSSCLMPAVAWILTSGKWAGAATTRHRRPTLSTIATRAISSSILTNVVGTSAHTPVMEAFRCALSAHNLRIQVHP